MDVVVKKIYISGVIHPRLSVDLILREEDTSVEVRADNQKLPIEIVGQNHAGRMIFNATLKKENKIVQLYIVKKNQKELLYTLKNSFPRRLFQKLKKIMLFILKPFQKIGSWVHYLWKEHHFLIPPFLWKEYTIRIIRKIRNIFRLDFYNPFRQKDYLKWTKKREPKPVYKPLKYKPLISILIPVYNIDRKYLQECLDSILNQHYENFEICLVDDCSTKQETKDTLKEYEKKDQRIKVHYRSENGHIAKATNDALKMASGEFVALMDNDDVLTENALYEMVYVLNQNKEFDFIYSDEDKLDMNGKRLEPHFKPDYSPDSLYGGNYICHFEILRKKIVEEIGGFKSEFVGAQDFDLFLRFMEKTTPEKVYHIPKILYHWRKVPGSTADTIESKEYAIENGKKAVEEALKRRNKKAEVIVPIKSTHYVVKYLYDKEPMVSIIIPTKDRADILETCLKSIYQKTDYQNYEIILINNGSKEKSTYELLEKYQKEKANFRVLNQNGEFNYSKLNNEAVKIAKGKFLLFLNNDTEIYMKDWIANMVGYAMQPHIGAVGAKLLYWDDTIQHGGVILGLNGVASHAFIKYDGGSYGFYGRLLVPYNYSAVTAACMMVEKKKFESVNGFEEQLKVSYNDIDLNLKLREEGYYNVFLPQVELYHYESASRGLITTKKKYLEYQKEKEYFVQKWGKELKNDPFYNPNWSLQKAFWLDKKERKK